MLLPLSLLCASSFRRSEYSSSRRLVVLLFLEPFQACSHTLERVASIPLERIPNWDEQMCYKQLTEVVGQEKRVGSIPWWRWLSWHLSWCVVSSWSNITTLFFYKNHNFFSEPWWFLILCPNFYILPPNPTSKCMLKMLLLAYTFIWRCFPLH